MGFVGLCLMSWMSISHFTLNRFNRASNESFMLWMRLSDEIPNDRPLVGISEEENSSFWDAEKQFNFYYNRSLYLLLIGSYVTVNMQIFLVDYEVDTRTYLIVQCVHSVHHFFFIRAYFTIFYTPNFFHLGMLRFFTKKFDYIRQQAIGLQDDTRKKRKKKTKKLEDNEYDQRLGELIHDFNTVYLELIQINNYFKYLSGINLFHFGFLTVIVTFVTQFSDLRLQILFYVVIYSMYILIFGLPFKLASGVLIEVEDSNFDAFYNRNFDSKLSKSTISINRPSFVSPDEQSKSSVSECLVQGEHRDATKGTLDQSASERSKQQGALWFQLFGSLSIEYLLQHLDFLPMH